VPRLCAKTNFVHSVQLNEVVLFAMHPLPSYYQKERINFWLSLYWPLTEII
jgi:hypothetical protein